MHIFIFPGITVFMSEMIEIVINDSQTDVDGMPHSHTQLQSK